MQVGKKENKEDKYQNNNDIFNKRTNYKWLKWLAVN